MKQKCVGKRLIAEKANIKCPYCEASSFAWSPRSDELRVCAACGLLFKYPLVTPEALEKLHDEAYSRLRHSQVDIEMATPTRYLSKTIAYLRTKGLGRQSTVLDYGAGMGDCVMMLKNMGCRVDGVEASSRAREQAENRGVVLTHKIDEHQVYDYVLGIEVVEHLTEPWALLRRFREVLRPGGVLYLTTPNRNSLLARLMKEQWREAKKPYHVSFFNAKTLQDMLIDVGFRRVEIIRFSPSTSHHPLVFFLHKILQLFGLYGSLRVIAVK